MSTQFKPSKEQTAAFDWLTGVGIMVIIGILISGVLTYISNAQKPPVGWGYWAIYVLCGILLLGGFLRWVEYDNRLANILWLSALTLLGIICMIMVGFEGAIWFLLMPITMQSAIFFSRIMTAIYTATLVIGLNLLAYSWSANGISNWWLWLSNTVTIGGLYAIGLVIQIALIEQFRARAEVERLNEQLRDYAIQSAELATAQERNRMAQTLHDSIGHALTVVSIQLEAAERLIQHDELAKATTAIQTARQVAREGLQDVRTSVYNLRSKLSDTDSKLSDALRSLLLWTVGDGRDTTLKASDEVLSKLDCLPTRSQGVVLRAIQEGLTNALKHAQPTTITLTIEQSEAFMRLSLTNDKPNVVAGDGIRSGLATMRQGVEALGGNVQTRTLSDSFTLIIEIPND
ncbi:MAG: sensor histidine kinase [Chloroflexota bacterium]